MTSPKCMNNRPCSSCARDTFHIGFKCQTCFVATEFKSVEYYYGGKRPKPQITETQRLELDRARRRKYALRSSRKSRVVMVTL